MKSKLEKVWKRSGDWGVWSFPKRNRILLWNDAAKKYWFYDIRDNPKGDRLDAALQGLEKRNREINYWRWICIVLSSLLGITLALLLLSSLNILNA